MPAGVLHLLSDRRPALHGVTVDDLLPSSKVIPQPGKSLLSPADPILDRQLARVLAQATACQGGRASRIVAAGNRVLGKIRLGGEGLKKE
jgi:hypothetical protein